MYMGVYSIYGIAMFRTVRVFCRIRVYGAPRTHLGQQDYFLRRLS